MDFQFEINKNLLFFSALVDRSSELPEWDDLRTRLWDKYRLGYLAFQGKYTKLFLNETARDTLETASDELLALVEEGLQSDEFSKLLSETEEYKTWLGNEWEQKKARVNQELLDILRAPLPKDQFKVVVFHPKLAEGRYLGKGTLAWGHSEDWSNYSVVYLCHEALHEFFGESDLEHSIIELVTDNELRIRLNGGGEYLYIDGELVGHENLLNLEKKILSKWLDYLKIPGKNVFELVEELEKI